MSQEVKKVVDRKEAARKAAATRKQNALEQKQFEQEQIDRAVAAYGALDELEQADLDSIFTVEDQLEESITEAIGEIVENVKDELRAALPKYGYAAVRGSLEQLNYMTRFAFNGWDNGGGLDLYQLLDEVATEFHLGTVIPEPGEYNFDTDIAAKYGITPGSPEWVKFAESGYGVKEEEVTPESIAKLAYDVEVGASAAKPTTCKVCGNQLTNGKCRFINHVN